MGRAQPSKAKAPKQRAKRMAEVDVTDSDEELLDDFRSGKDKINFTGGHGNDSDGDLKDEAVYALSEDDSDDDDDIEEGGKIGRRKYSMQPTAPAESTHLAALPKWLPHERPLSALLLE